MCLESPGGSSIVFFEHPELSAETFLNEQRANLSQVLATDIRVWGSLEGYGEVLKGTQLEFKVPMELTVFECTTPHKLILVQTMLTEEQKHVNPGFDLIESSFKPLTIPS